MTSTPAPTDTLVYDAAAIADWQGQPVYDYNRELVTPEIDIIGWINLWMGKLLRKIFGNRFAEEYTEIVLVGLFVIAVLLIIWFLYKKHPELFMRSKKNLVYRVQEDTIYGIDFRKEIDTALLHNDYREAIRFLYLQTLKQLSDAERIDWKLYKTPTEYLYEVKSYTLRSAFGELTNRFLRVRYGNFEASEALFREMQSLQDEIMKGGAE